MSVKFLFKLKLVGFLWTIIGFSVIINADELSFTEKIMDGNFETELGRFKRFITMNI